MRIVQCLAIAGLVTAGSVLAPESSVVANDDASGSFGGGNCTASYTHYNSNGGTVGGAGVTSEGGDAGCTSPRVRVRRRDNGAWIYDYSPSSGQVVAASNSSYIDQACHSVVATSNGSRYGFCHSVPIVG